jgi:hypothetical protein
VFNTGRYFATFCPVRTEVAEPGGKRNEIKVDFIRTHGLNLVHPDTHHTVGEVMLLLAGYFTGVAPGAVFVFNK